MDNFKLCWVTTIDGLAAAVDLHQLDDQYVPMIVIRHPNNFGVALDHKARGIANGYHLYWAEQASLLTALIGYGPDVVSKVAAIIHCFPPYGKRPDYRKPEAYRAVAAFMQRIRAAFSAWGWANVKIGVDFERDGQWKEDPAVQPYADERTAAVALAGAFGCQDAHSVDFVLPVQRGDAIQSMEVVAAADRGTVMVWPQYYPSRSERLPAGMIPQLWGSPIEPDYKTSTDEWTKLHTCAELLAFDGQAMIYFRSEQERDGLQKMADLIEATNAPPVTPTDPDPSTPYPKPDPPATRLRTDPDDLDVNELRDVVGHKKYDQIIKAANMPGDSKELRKPNSGGSAVVGTPPAN